MVYSANIHNIQGWARPTPGFRSATQVSHVGSRDPRTWAIICYLPECMNRMPSLKWNSQNSSQALWYVIRESHSVAYPFSPQCQPQISTKILQMKFNTLLTASKSGFHAIFIRCERIFSPWLFSQPFQTWKTVLSVGPVPKIVSYMWPIWRVDCDSCSRLFNVQQGPVQEGGPMVITLQGEQLQALSGVRGEEPAAHKRWHHASLTASHPGVKCLLLNFSNLKHQIR